MDAASGAWVARAQAHPAMHGGRPSAAWSPHWSKVALGFDDTRAWALVTRVWDAAAGPWPEVAALAIRGHGPLASGPRSPSLWAAARVPGLEPRRGQDRLGERSVASWRPGTRTRRAGQLNGRGAQGACMILRRSRCSPRPGARAACGSPLRRRTGPCACGPRAAPPYTSPRCGTDTLWT
jgi:hypothetical protein